MRNLLLLLLLLLLMLPSAATAESDEPATTAVAVEMVEISPGTFVMGSPPDEEGRDSDEQQHEVTLTRGFLLGKYEITQTQWQAVMGTNPAKIKGENHPVEQVSWNDCIQFCNALSELEGLAPAYRIDGETVIWNQGANGYRLPTEAEWEYACRAGTTTPFAGELDKMAIYARNSGRKTRDVGGRQPNAWGLHDMHGNVWEWVWDQYHGDFAPDSVIDPATPPGDRYQVQRGGSWHRKPRDLRSASRGTDNPNARRNGLGLRVARSLP